MLGADDVSSPAAGGTENGSEERRKSERMIRIVGSNIQHIQTDMPCVFDRHVHQEVLTTTALFKWHFFKSYFRLEQVNQKRSNGNNRAGFHTPHALHITTTTAV